MKNLNAIQRAYDKGEISDIEYENKLREFSSRKFLEINDILEDLISIGRISSEQRDEIMSIFDNDIED